MEVAVAAAQILRQGGATLFASADLQPVFGLDLQVQYMPFAQACQLCDVVLTVGGDGTMLHAARHTMVANKPLVGINTGRLGFLTTIEKDELHQLHRLFTKDYLIEERSVLQASCGDYTCVALNDVVLFKELPEKTITLDIFCDDILVSRFRGDGVIFSTPTGSTAYSMSAGGPILDARLGGIIVTQICAHIVQTPPMVFAQDRVITVKPRHPKEEAVFIGCDGMPSQHLSFDHSVFITQSDRTVPLIQFSEAEQLKSIDKKLKGR